MLTTGHSTTADPESRSDGGALLTPDEVRRLLEVCSSQASTGLRNRAMITVMYRCGLRVSESISLAEMHVDGLDRTIHVSRPSRVVALDASSYQVLDMWIRRRKSLQIQPTAPLFCTLRGDRLSPSYVRALFTRLGAKARIGKRISAEVLRRTLVAELAREGVPIGLIQAQLGHRSSATTERYIARVAPRDLFEVMRGRNSWLP